MNMADDKPVVESFQLDHTKVKAPYVRYIDTETGPHGDVISNYDLRLVQPNEGAIPTGGLHTIEHTIAVLLRERIPGYIDCSPFGCRTGFHLLTWGEHSTEDVARALKEALEFIAYEATWDDVPATTIESCGNYRDHSLFTAKEWAKDILAKGISSGLSETTSERRFRRATMEDLPAMLGIYQHARELMAANGNPTQWGNTFPREEVVRDDIRQRRTILLVDEVNGRERILAQFALCTGDDPTYAHIDGAWLDDDPYVTIHRIASSGIAKGAAKDCINWCIEHYGNVRADTHPNNKAMQHVLESNGFARCGLIQLLDRPTDTTRIAYQRHEW